MHKYKLLLLIIFLIIIYVFSPKINLSVNQPITQVYKLKTINNSQPLMENKKTEKNDNHTTDPFIKFNITSDYFSKDPIINIEIIEALYEECFEYFKGNNSFKHTINSNEFEDQLDKFFNNCEKINIKHPEFLLDNWDLFSEQSIQASSQSLLSKITKRYSKTKLTDNYDEGLKIIKQLKNENPNILLTRQLRYQLYDFYLEYYLLDIYTLLNTQNEGYVIHVLLYAEILMACRLGAACGENSFQLLLKCYKNDAFCGLKSFEKLINSKLTISQQYDIYLLVEYLEKLIEIDNQ